MQVWFLVQLEWMKLKKKKKKKTAQNLLYCIISDIKDEKKYI